MTPCDYAAFYRGQSVLVTGGASFIGSHLVEQLVVAGACVRVADDLSSGRRENLAACADRIEFHEGDLRARAFAAEMCAGVGIVFHLAAAHGGRGYIDTHPFECAGNMALDHTVFAAAAIAGGVRKIVYASSACVYPTHLQADAASRALLREGEANCDEPGRAFADGEYGWAKLMGELQLRALHRQHGIAGIACRIFTAYGERENASHAVIALLAKAAARLDPFPIWGDGTQTRNFTYVADTVRGLLLAGACLDGCATINLGTSTHHTIKELAAGIFRVVGWEPRTIRWETDRPVGVRSRAADNTRCREQLGWEPATPLADGLTRTAHWHRATHRPTTAAELDRRLLERA